MSELSSVDTRTYGRCADCPFIVNELSRIEKYSEARDELIMLSMSDDEIIIDTQTEVLGVVEDLGLTASGDMPTPHDVRQNIGIVDGEITERIDTIYASIRDRTRGCMGSVTLTGLTPDGRRQFSANACASPRLPSGDSQETVTIRRDRI